MLLPRSLASLFASDPDLIAFSAKALRIYAATICLFGIQMSCQTTFTSIGFAFSSIIVAVMRKLVLLIPLIYLLPAIFTNNQTMSVYLSEPIADFLSVAFCSFLFIKQFNKAIGTGKE